MPSYDKEIIKKQAYVEKLLSGLVPEIEPVVRADNPLHYRNKVHAAVGISRGKVIAGTYEPGTHRIIDGGGNDLENEAAVAVIEDIVNIANKYHMSVYNEKTGTGLLRRVLIRTADGTGQMLVVVVLGDFMFPGKKNFVKTLVSKHPEITSIVININKRKDSMILGDKSEVVYGPGFITDTLLGKKFTISAESFYQVNHDQAEKLYSKAFEYASLDKSSHVLDAYCGTGTIGICASDHCGSVVGVEINPRAVSDAKKNIRLNDASNVSVIKADATEYMNEVSSSSEPERFDVVILDPPREGTTPEFIKACGKLAPSRIVYISCNPETLARDLKLFAAEGYKAVKACPVDMFCFTEHVECVVLLNKA
jgi:23S rRNA (uracil1939-C5)-methyltransferase